MIRARLVFCCLLACAPFLYAADGASTPEVIANSLQGKVVFLRGMDSGDKLSFDGQGQEIGAGAPGPFAYSAIKVEGVHESGTAVEIKGQRVALVFQGTSQPPSTKDIHYVPLKEAVVVNIAIDSSDPQAFEATLNRVFATTPDSALAGKTPEEQQTELYTIGSTTLPDSTPPKNVVSSSEFAKRPSEVSAPRLIHSVDPQYTKDAKAKHISGICVLSMVVDVSGHPTHIRVARSLDPALDTQAIIAVSQYRLKPAHYRDKDVPVVIRVEVNFRTF